MIKKLLLFVRLLFLPQLSLFSVDDSRRKLSVTAKMFCFALLFCASFANATNYYSAVSSTDTNNLNHWWANTNGTGGHPGNFTGADVFIVQTGHSMATTAAWAVSGSLQIQTGGSLDVTGFDITISGTTSVTGTLVHSSNTGTKTYVGLVTIVSGGLWNNSSNTGVIFRGGITNNGTFTSGSGVQTFNTNNQSLIGTLSIPRVTVTAVSLTNTNTLTVATALAGNGTLVNSGTLNISAATVGITTLTATGAGNTVNYNGAAQTIKSTSYYNLTFSGSGIKTFGATTVATSNFINVAKGIQLDLSGNNNHTARVLILGGVGPLISSWGAQGSGAANTTNTFFTTTLYGRIIVSGSGTFDPVIDSNYASYTKGVSGKVNASYVENATPVPVLTAPNGTVFINADFASYGTPAGTAPNFTLGTCNAFNSKTVATDVFLGNTTATIPATNATFGDPCVSIVKRLSVVATYTEPICTGTSPGLITGSPPSGGNGSYTYLWEVSTTNATTGYAAAPGTNNAKDYTPGNLTATSWFRRTVYSGLYASETIVIVQVNTAPVAPTAIANTAFCAGSSTTLTVSGGSTGGNGGYAQWYTGSCGGTLVGSGTSITVTPTAPTTYYVRYQNGCTTTACFSKLVEATVSITAASAATPVCYNTGIQTTPLSYSATTGTPTTYSIAWNSTPANSFVAVPYTTLPAGNISISIPAGTNPGSYTGKLTVRDAAATCVSLENIFTVTVNPLPTITGTPTVCIGSTTQLTGSATANATTPWTSATTSVATVDNTGLVTGVAAGTSVITYRNSNGCTQTVTVTVNPLPTITGTPTVCIGSTTQLTGSATPNATTPWSSATTSVATVDNAGLVTGVAAGTSVITYRNSIGCTQTITVTVNPLPTITGTPAVCIGSTTQLAGSATPNATTPWTSATTSVATVSNTGLVTGVAAGTSVITYRNSNGCTQTVTVTVNPLPTITGTPTVCIGSTTQLTGSATPNATTPWTSATTSVATVSNTGLVTGVAAGTSVITYTNNNGCTQTVTVTVNPLPTITGTPAVCIGSTTQLTGSATPNATTPWTSATTSVATVSNTGLVTGVAAGTSVITYTNNNGCTQTVTVTVNPL
ncbi:beta strand repeat-containing protein, partial [Flavobacterium circumlabens]